MPIHRPFVEGILGESRQQDMYRPLAGYELIVRTDRTLIRKTISCFKIIPTARRSSFTDMNMRNSGRWMKGRNRTIH